MEKKKKKSKHNNPFGTTAWALISRSLRRVGRISAVLTTETQLDVLMPGHAQQACSMICTKFCVIHGVGPKGLLTFLGCFMQCGV